MSNPEIANSIKAAGLITNYHDAGESVGGKAPVMLIHGSGPGVSAWANWRLTIPELAKGFRVIAPDIAGFGYTERPEKEDGIYTLDFWLDHLTGLLDALDLEKVSVVGNSFGGAMALALAIRYPARVEKLVLMGAVGIGFDITPGLDAVWGYTPSVPNMKELMNVFAFDKALLTDDLAELRFKASTRPGVQESYSRMFPAPRQEGVDRMTQRDEDIAAIGHPTLIVHGREDQVIPVSNAIRLNELIGNSQLHVYGHCGHWTQLEQTGRFNRLVSDFLSEEIIPHE